MDKTGVNRVNYFSRQVLRTQDFTDEQAYHLEARRRHGIAQHLWGIVSGLELSKDKDGTVFVTPGVAIDGYGRELVLPSGRAVPPRAFDERLTDSLDVWAVYSRTAGDLGDPAYQPCVPPADRVNYRWSEIATIEWTRSVETPQVNPELGVPECRQPADVPAEDLSFDPTRVAPDDPAVRWPIFLGRIDRTGSGNDTKFLVDMGGRPYAGARAEAIVTPAGDGRLQIGTSCDDNSHRFALLLRDPQQIPSRLVPRLTLDAAGAWEIRGTTTVRGDVKVAGGAMQFGEGAEYGAEKPWSIYRAKTTQGQQAFEELRIEMKASPGGGQKHQVTVGVFSQGQFTPCLTIADDCTVTAHGDLIVKGNFQAGSRVAQTLSEQTNAIAASVFIGGLMQSLNLAVAGGAPAHSLLEAAGRADPEMSIEAMLAVFRQNPAMLRRLRDALDVADGARGPGRAGGRTAGGKKRGMPPNDAGGGGDTSEE